MLNTSFLSLHRNKEGNSNGEFQSETGLYSGTSQEPCVIICLFPSETGCSEMWWATCHPWGWSQPSGLRAGTSALHLPWALLGSGETSGEQIWNQTPRMMSCGPHHPTRNSEPLGRKITIHLISRHHLEHTGTLWDSLSHPFSCSYEQALIHCLHACPFTWLPSEKSPLWNSGSLEQGIILPVGSWLLPANSSFGVISFW